MMYSMTTPLETLLAQAHAQPGEPQARLQDLLSALEGSDWTLLLDGEEALAAQLASVLGPGLIRLDPRLSVNRETFASRGLALASSDGDWKGARAVWLLEPDERALTRARRADVPVMVDATLSPGGRWLEQGAQLVVYRDAATLSGYGDVRLSALSGLGSVPRRSAPAAADLAVALALRDIGTLALRMNRRSRNAESLHERFGGRALPVSGGVLLLEHDGPSTITPLGGNLSAARAVAAGTLITVGIEHPDDAWAILGAALSEAAAHDDTPDAEFTETERTNRPENVPQAVPEAPVQQLAEPVRQAPEPERAAPPPDYSDREFVFSPPPVLPTLPSQPNQASQLSQASQANQPSQPNQASRPGQGNPPRQERGRSRRGGRGQDTAAGEAVPPTEIAAPEIVMSQSFQRPAQAAQEQDEQAGSALSPQAGADQWPEEAAAQTEVFAAAELAEADAAQTTGQPPVQLSVPLPEATPTASDLPLQLPPDLPDAAAPDPASDLTDEQQAIYARLREWRNAEAKRQTVSRFIIASNATLAEVARRVPYTEADLKAVKGMGPERLRKYGEKILEVVRG